MRRNRWAAASWTNVWGSASSPPTPRRALGLLEPFRQASGAGGERVEIPESLDQVVLVADLERAAGDRDAVEVAGDVDVRRAEPHLRSQLAESRSEGP